MPVRVDLSSNSSVKLLCVDDDNTACAYLANLYIPIFSLNSGKLIRRYEVSNQIVGLHINHKRQNILYACDDSFGLHIFDLRANQKQKKRLNPDVENHNVICTALSSNNILAVASSEFGGGILDVRGSRRREHRPNVISLFDLRNPSEPLTTYHKRHKAEVCSMEYYKNGNDLLTGDVSGAIKSFNTACRDEDNAVRWERWARGPITKVGIINKRIVYGISNRSEVTVFVDSKGDLEVLYGTVVDSADEEITKTSKAFYKKPEWCLGLMKGINDHIPLVAVHGAQNENYVSLTAMTQAGVRQEKPLLSYEGHTGEVKCMVVTPKLLLTGGEDGTVIIQHADFKHPKFGEDSIPHHRLTLDRGDLADKHDRGSTDEEEVGEPAPPARESSDSSGDSDNSDTDGEDARASTSSGKALTSSTAAASSSSSSSSAPKSSAPAASSAKSSSSSDQKKKKKDEGTDDDDDEPRRPPNKEKKSSSSLSTREEMLAKRQREDEALKEREAKIREKKERKRAAQEGEWEELTDPEEIRKAEEEEKIKEAQRAIKRAKKAEKQARELQRQKEKEEKIRKREEYEAAEAARNDPAYRKAKEEKEARRQEKLAEKARKAAEEKKAAEEREKRRAMKLLETKEERTARKDRERKEREKAAAREREERKKKHDGEGSSGSSSAKKSKHK